MSVVSDDFPIPMKILVSTGAGTVFEPRARARNPTARTLRQEWKRKIRSHVAFLCDITILKVPDSLAKRDMAAVLVKLRVLCLCPVCDARCAGGVAVALKARIYQLALSGQALFYSSAVAGFLLLCYGIRLRLPYICLHFVFANSAVGLARSQWLREGHYHMWCRTERILPVVGSERRKWIEG